MLKLLLIIPFALSAQESNFQDNEYPIDSQNLKEPTSFYEYVSLNENKIYDIEIMVFAYNQALPNYKTFSNKLLYDDSQALKLDFKPEDMEYVKNESSNVDDVNTELQNDNNMTVPLDDATEDQFALAWFLHQPEHYKLNPIWDRLVQSNDITPLIHQSWRQIETPFNDPTYVQLNNLNDSSDEFKDSKLNEIEIEPNQEFTISQESNDEFEEETLPYPDFTVTGMVALSQGRFMHFGHKLNLIRHFTDESGELKQMVFALSERKQLKTDELHYFDSPWFGSIVKVTEYKGEDLNGETDE